MSIPVLESGLVSQRVISEEIEKIQAGAAAGQTQPRLDFAPYRSAVLRHPARDLRYADPEGAELVAPVFGRSDVDPLESDLTIQGAGEPIGSRILVRGRVLDGDGRPVRGQLVEIWQANAAGRYVHQRDVCDGEGNGVEDALLEIRQADASGAVPVVPGSLRREGAPFTGWGRSSTDPGGHYWFSTVEPGPARPGSAPFFAVTVFARGLLNRLFTRIYLPAGQAVLEDAPLLASLETGERGAMVATREADGSLRFDIHLQGPRETPFLTFPGHQR